MRTTRRNFIAGAAVGSAGALVGNKVADARQISPEAERFELFRRVLGKEITALPPERLTELLASNGAIDLDYLVLTYSKRFPTLTPEEVLARNPRLRRTYPG